MADLGTSLGRGLVGIGLILLVAGALLLWGPRLPWVGRLPGDVRAQWGPVRVYFPLATGLLVSLILTVLLNIFLRLRSP